MRHDAYYEDEKVVLYCGRCEEILPTLSGIGAIVTDPPYEINFAPCKEIPGCDRPFDPIQLIPYPKVVLWGANHFADRLPPSNGWIVWDKRLHAQFENDFSDCEMAWTNLNVPTRMFRHLWTGLIKGSEFRDARYHPSQKPVALMSWILARYTDPADLICDPYCGSGTTLVAAKKNEQKCIGIEIREEYCEATAKRLSQGVLEFTHA